MKKLRNFYFILGLFAIAFAILTRLIPGVTIIDFVNGFCWGLGVAMLIAGAVTSAIPYLYRNDKKKTTPAAHDDGDTKSAATDSETGTKTPDATDHDSSVSTQ